MQASIANPYYDAFLQNIDQWTGLRVLAIPSVNPVAEQPGSSTSIQPTVNLPPPRLLPKKKGGSVGLKHVKKTAALESTSSQEIE